MGFYVCRHGSSIKSAFALHEKLLFLNIIENIPPKGMWFSNFITTFVMPIVLFQSRKHT